MRAYARWFYIITGLAAAFVAVATVVQAIREGSWGPIVSVGWLPAVVIASWPAARRRCLRGRGGPVG